MKIVITGGAGYIGYGLADLLTKENQVSSVLIYDNLSRQNDAVFFSPISRPEKIKLIKADILDTRKLRKALDGADVLIHLAARVSTPFANQDAHFFEQVNHWGTAETVYAAEAAKIKRVIYLSSASVYGKTTERATEATIPNPQSYYGISKLRGEEHVARLMDSTETYIIRCGNVYGYSPALRFDAVINNFMLQANLENRLTIHGSGMQKRSFAHVNDVDKMLSQMVFTNARGGTYNFIRKTLSINEIADIFEILFPKLERIYINQHIGMSSLEVSIESALNRFLHLDETSLLDELKAFKSRFAFGNSLSTG